MPAKYGKLVVLFMRGVVVDGLVQDRKLVVEGDVIDTQSVEFGEGTDDVSTRRHTGQRHHVAVRGVPSRRRMDDRQITEFVHVHHLVELREEPFLVCAGGLLDLGAESPHLIVLVETDLDNIGNGHSGLATDVGRAG
jgi:hypothetical protein